VDARSGAAVERSYRSLGACTNNAGESEGLLLALNRAIDLGVAPRLAAIRGDSKLVVRQVRGEWAVREPSLMPRFLEARRLLARLGVDASLLEHVERERNALADELANVAIDTQTSFSPEARAAPQRCGSRAARAGGGGRSRAACAGAFDENGFGGEAAAAVIQAGAARGVCRMAAIAGALRDFSVAHGLDAEPEYEDAPRLSARAALDRASARGALTEAREKALRRELGQLESARSAERRRAAAFAAADHNLDELNMWLAGFGCDAAPSKRVAVKELAKINANIYDVMDGVYKNHKSLWKLAWYTKQNQMIFPLKEAKEDNRKIFLKNLKHCW